MTLVSAIALWMRTATGIAADRIRWAKQGQVAPRPASPGPWIELREMGGGAGGPDWATLARNPLVIPDDAIESVDATANTLTLTAHGLQTGDGPVRLTTTGTLPGGLATATDYWAIRSSADAIQLAATFLGAIETPTPIDITDAGTGTHTLVDTADTLRVGEELIATTRGTRMLTLAISCFGGDATGDNSSEAYLDRARAAAALPGLRATMRAAGAVVASIGQTRDVSMARSSVVFEPRATMDARIVVDPPVLTETLSVIATAEAVGTVT